MLKNAFRFLPSLGLFLLLQVALTAQTQDSPLPSQRYFANFRMKASLREVGLNLMPFAKRMPWLSIGAGYHFGSSFIRKMDCLYGEPARLNGSLKGPFVVVGYDPKNNGAFKRRTFSAFVGYKQLDGGRVEYLETDCLTGSAGTYSDYQLYDATAKELFFKFMLEKHNEHKPWRSFYMGLGGAFRQVTRAYIERGTLDEYYPTRTWKKGCTSCRCSTLGCASTLFG
jgi:hypothetical protein